MSFGPLIGRRIRLLPASLLGLAGSKRIRHQAANSADSFTRTFDYGSGATNYLQQVALAGAQVAYQYDAAGNVTQENGSRHSQWDAADQLRQFATWTGAGTAPTLLAYYVYDAKGQRAKKLTQTAAGSWQATIYVGEGFEHRYEINPAQHIQEQTVILIGSENRPLYQRRSGAVLGDQRPSQLYSIDDYLGSDALQTDATGLLVTLTEFYPFRETSFGSYQQQRYRFCAKELDQESGLYYYGLRYYAPWLCRFVSVDPLAREYPFYTPYQYAGNKPITFTDLDGGEEKRGSEYAPLTYDRLKEHATEAGVYRESFGDARNAAKAKGETDKDKISRAGHASANRRIGGGFERAFLKAFDLKSNGITFQTDVRKTPVKPDAILGGLGVSLKQKSLDLTFFKDNIFVEIKSTPEVNLDDPNGGQQIKGEIKAVADRANLFSKNQKSGDIGAGFLLLVTVAGAKINPDIRHYAEENHVALYHSEAFENPDKPGYLMFSEPVPISGLGGVAHILNEIAHIFLFGKPIDLKLIGKEVKLDLTQKDAAQGGNQQ